MQTATVGPSQLVLAAQTGHMDQQQLEASTSRLGHQTSLSSGAVSLPHAGADVTSAQGVPCASGLRLQQQLPTFRGQRQFGSQCASLSDTRPCGAPPHGAHENPTPLKDVKPE